LKFQTVAEKTAKDARGLLYFAAPGRSNRTSVITDIRQKIYSIRTLLSRSLKAIGTGSV